ncbi:MAG: CCA tRNA nucleotidyltransferase [Candidatus Pacebacteria bacterium]|nr:CCA tRNA nucleotidyltransferase [Candidatus Paceibacterota bacterium]
MEQIRNFVDNKEKSLMGKFEKKEIQDVSSVLEKAGFEAYLVGGCVRDVLMGRKPKDWDITTNAKPEEIQKIFSDFGGATPEKPATVYENDFGTVGIKTGSEDEALKIIEVTTYRLEGKYTDKRHPDEIKFAKTIEEDLARRDFTVNAMALSMFGKEGKLVDLYGGQDDLKKKTIKAVGDPNKRFEEDALRILRAVRFAAQLDFVIEAETEQAVKKNVNLLEFISKERIRDEFSKLLMTGNAVFGIEKMRESGILKYVIPELEDGFNMAQNKHHIYSVYEHNIRSLDYAVKNNFPLDLRLATLLHDVGKPKSKRGEGPDATFYGHQVVGEKMAAQILDRLHFPKEMIERVALLIREHMFVYDPETVTDAGARRLLRRVGQENINDLLLLREADRIGSGVPKAQPYRLRHLKFRLEKVSKDPVSAKMLKINGGDIMNELKIQPGPKIGFILAIILEEVLDDPSLNDKEVLVERAKILGQMEDKKLAEMAKFAKKSADEAQNRIEEEIKQKYFVD